VERAHAVLRTACPAGSEPRCRLVRQGYVRSVRRRSVARGSSRDPPREGADRVDQVGARDLLEQVARGPATMAPIKASSSKNELSIRYADLTHDADVVVGLKPPGNPPAHDLVVVQETHGNRQWIVGVRNCAHSP
jgi:hypothetical protein